ncbi:unnamed protein product [Rhizoctonia solani]|uniref:Uncharacterized protein n=1 Tax=Rhizoctonia solani TaxID=456999 RepID=A0A8H3HRT8_9AGAM|nr:unnamed protein product [Rhizoctonia solani]
MTMPIRLPIELLDLITQDTTIDTQTRLSAVSRSFYSISVPRLYASIPELGISRMTKCLLTLSTKPELASLVRSFSFNLFHSPHVLQAFVTLLSRALGNMNNLHTLSFRLGFAVPRAMNLLVYAPLRLTKLECNLPPEGSYPVAQFLSTQPTIEELLIICRTEDISTLPYDALPALKDLAAPLRLLPRLLLPRLPRLSRLTALEVMTDPEDLIMLALLFTASKPSQLIELILRAKITENTMSAVTVTVGLGLLGLAAPSIQSLMLGIYGDHIDKSVLQVMFSTALPNFPNLKLLVLTSPAPAQGAYIPGPQMQLVRTLSRTHTFFYNVLASVSSTVFDFSGGLINFSSILSVFSPRQSAPSAESDQSQNQPEPTLDALHDKTCHLEIVKAWRQVQPGLECVSFPPNIYICSTLFKD